MFELWKEVDGFDGYYEVSDKGRVKSLDRVIKHSNGVCHNVKGRMLKPIFFGNYHGVQMCNHGKLKKKYIHRLVAETFVENTHNKKTVNHKDGNKFNNSAENLEWATQKENNRHAVETGLNKTMGSDNHMCKHSYDVVLRIRLLKESGEYTQRKIASMTGVSNMQVSRIVRGIARRNS